MFSNREEAGKKLAKRLSAYRDDPDTIILALPRGGVVLGYEVSHALHLPLDLILVRKLGVPGQEELAFGAISLDGVKILNQHILSILRIDPRAIDRIISKEELELARRNQLYRKDLPFPNIKDKVVILIDDGIATGATMKAAIKIVALHQPQKIIVAVPLASSSVYQDLSDDKVELVVLETPEPFYGIGMWYGEFAQLTDEQVIALLAKAQQEQSHE